MLQHVFPSLAQVPCWVGVAFQAGSVYKPYEALIMAATMGKFVHCELLLGEGMHCKAYSAYRGGAVSSCSGGTNSAGSTGFVPSLLAYDPATWEVLVCPVRDLKTAQLLALRLLDARIPYNERDLWQCCFQAVLPFETDIDCAHVPSWKRQGVFCSQMCVLFLRYLAQHGELVSVGVQGKMDDVDTLQHHLHAVHSRGCSPNMLYALLSQHFGRI